MDIDIPSMKVADLKRELKARSLSTNGIKTELVERLQAAVAGGVAVNPDDDDDDALLMDDTAPVQTVVKAAVAPASPSKVSVKASAPKTAISAPAAAATVKPAAASPPAALAAPASTTEANGTAAEVASPTSDAKKLSDEDRAQARAARFGITAPASEDAKKSTRAERFGIKDDKTKADKIGAAPTADLETLKKRAARFGQVSAPAVKSAELDEKVKKRQERFGVVEAEVKSKKAKTEPASAAKEEKAAAAPAAAAAPVVMDEKMKKRAERFKITV